MNTIQPGSVVVAADGSPESDRAVLWAVEEAHLERRPLAVVTVVPDADGAANHAAVELARRWRPGVEVQGAAIEGTPRRLLPEISAGAHLLVLGSRGRGRISSAVLGSVSAKISSRASCPVVVCRPGPVGRVRHGILVCVDGTRDSAPAIEFAFRQASLRDLPLTVVNAAGGDDSPAELVLAESLAGFRELFPEVFVTRQTETDFTAESSSRSSARWHMVVVGRATEGAARPTAGPSVTEVVEHAHTYVAVVPARSSERPVVVGTNDPSLSVPRP